MGGGREAIAEAGGKGIEVGAALGFAGDDVKGGEGGPDAGGGQGGVEDEGPRTVHEVVDHGLAGGDEAARGGERLRERADDDDPLGIEAEAREGALAVGAEYARCVGLIEDEDSVVRAGQLDECGEGGDVAVHAEDGLADNEAAAGGGGGEELGEVLGVAMAVDLCVGAGETAAVDD